MGASGEDEESGLAGESAALGEIFRWHPQFVVGEVTFHVFHLGWASDHHRIRRTHPVRRDAGGEAGDSPTGGSDGGWHWRNSFPRGRAGAAVGFADAAER